MAQDEHGLRADVVVALAERAAETRSHAEHVEEVGGHDRRLDPVGLPLVQQHERHRVELDQVPDRLEAGAIVVQLLDRDAGVVHVRRRRRLLDEHELVPFGKGSGASSTPRITENMAVFAPMPSASTLMAAAV